jgi:hypothetical protein
MNGIVKEILIAENAGDDLFPLKRAEFVSGKGIEGDRYFNSIGTFSEKLKESGDFEVTLIEQEEIDAFNNISGLNYSNSYFRRNIVTTGIRLNPLVGSKLSLGEVQLTVVRLCEPCAYLSDILGEEIMQHMVHKAGIRAVITKSGIAEAGNTVGQC